MLKRIWDRKKSVSLVVIIIAVSITAWFQETSSKNGINAPDKLVTSRAKRGTVNNYLLADGEIEANHSIEVTSPKVRGYYSLVVENRIEEGTRVKAGDTLVTFSTSELEKDLAALEDSLLVKKVAEEKRRLSSESFNNGIRANIIKQGYIVKQHKLKITNSESISRKERQSRRLRYQQSVVAEKKLNARLASELEKDKSEISIYNLQKGKIQTKMKQLKEGIDSYSVRSPGSGMVIHPRVWLSGFRGKIKEGTAVNAGISVIKLPDLGSLIAVVYINEIDVLRIKKGLLVRLYLSIKPRRPILGTVIDIGLLPTTRKEREGLSSNDPEYLVKEFKVKIALKTKGKALIPGMGFRAKIRINRKKNVLRIPMSAMIQKGNRKKVLLKKDQLIWRRIKVGLIGNTHIEVANGLKEGDEVVLNFDVHKL